MKYIIEDKKDKKVMIPNVKKNKENALKKRQFK